MKKLIFISLALIFLTAVFNRPVQAADLTITCTKADSDCKLSSSGALFNVTDWAPGETVIRLFEVDNTKNPDDCDVLLKTKNIIQKPTDFGEKLFTVIKTGATDIYGARDGDKKASSLNTLADLFGETDVSLGVVAGNGSTIYDWIVTFDPETDDDYQEAETVFDFDLVFECGEPSGGDAGGDGGAGGAGTATTATTAWSPFVFPDTGIFRFVPSVLGVEEREEAVPGPSPGPEIKGEAIKCHWWQYLWWLALLVQAILTWFYYRWLKNKTVVAWWLLPFIFSLLSQLIHELIGCECVVSKWCSWYWIFNMLILASLTYLYFRSKNK